jgi:hypothetical protein
LASGKEKQDSIDLSVEAAELHQDVLSSLAHELGGIASALDLRAAAMSRTIPEQDTTALRDIAEEVRMATRAARFARGSDGFGMLNPMRRQSLDEWWRLTSRFTAAVLPRGVQVEPRFGEAQLTALQASSLTWLWLAACKEIGEKGLTTPASIVLQGSGTAGNGPVDAGRAAAALVAEIDRDRIPSLNGTKSRWSPYVARVAKELGVEAPCWEAESDKVRWRLTIPA